MTKNIKRIDRNLLLVLLIILVSGFASAQEPVEEIIRETYVYGKADDIYVIGKVTELSVVKLTFMNFKADKVITFDRDKDNLFIKRGRNSLKSTSIDYYYLSNKIFPGRKMDLSFYLPQYKNITHNETYYLTYNVTEDTIYITPTTDEEIIMYVNEKEVIFKEGWFKKAGYRALFVTVAIVTFILL